MNCIYPLLRLNNYHKIQVYYGLLKQYVEVAKTLAVAEGRVGTVHDGV